MTLIPKDKAKPIFIMGIAGRSGTHYLRQLLNKHPDISNSVLMREDHFVSELNLLEKYVKRVSYYWRRKDDEHEANIIRKYKIGLGSNAVSDFAKEAGKHYFLLNTPETRNLDLFPEYYPNQKIIIIIRNAKDLTESGVRSKFWSYEEALEIWRVSARRIIKATKNKDFNPYIIKYEDLYSHTKDRLSELLEYLELSKEKYPFEAINKLKIQGSSDAKAEKNTWEYKNIEKSENFDPLNRSAGWSRYRLWRYDYKCGRPARQLGYEDEIFSHSIFYYFVNIVFGSIPSVLAKAKIALKLKAKQILADHKKI